MQTIRTRARVPRLRSKDEGGASAVEFALVLPVFLLLIFGLLQYGMIFLLRNQLTEAASDAARSAVVSTSQSGAEGIASASLDKDIDKDGTGLINTSSGCATSGITCTVTALPPTDPACKNVPTTGYACLQVTIKYDYADHPILGLPFIPTPSTVTGSSSVIIGNGALTQ